MIIWGDADETMLQEKDHMNDDKLKKAITMLRDCFGPTKKCGTYGLSENAQFVIDAAERSMALPSLPHPDSLDDKALFAMWDAQHPPNTKCGAMRSAYKALYDHLTKPKTKMVEVWRVEYAILSSVGGWTTSVSHYVTEDVARYQAGILGRSGARCICVTGPHQQEVPCT